MTTNRKLLEVVAILAAYPLEEFAMEGKADDYPLFGANDWKLLVGHVRRAREALEEEKETPWIEWKGNYGFAPVDLTTVVSVVCRSGAEFTDYAGAFGWDVTGEDQWDIVAYRIAKQ